MILALGKNLRTQAQITKIINDKLYIYIYIYIYIKMKNTENYAVTPKIGSNMVH